MGSCSSDVRPVCSAFFCTFPEVTVNTVSSELMLPSSTESILFGRNDCGTSRFAVSRPTRVIGIRFVPTSVSPSLALKSTGIIHLSAKAFDVISLVTSAGSMRVICEIRCWFDSIMRGTRSAFSVVYGRLGTEKDRR